MREVPVLLIMQFALTFGVWIAAAASGGATIAPSAIATGQDMPGTSQRATSATAITVVPTAAITSPAIGRQWVRRSRSEVS